MPLPDCSATPFMKTGKATTGLPAYPSAKICQEQTDRCLSLRCCWWGCQTNSSMKGKDLETFPKPPQGLSPKHSDLYSNLSLLLWLPAVRRLSTSCSVSLVFSGNVTCTLYNEPKSTEITVVFPWFLALAKWHENKVWGDQNDSSKNMLLKNW